MVPPRSDRISRVPPYSRTPALSTRTGLSPAMARLSRRFRFLRRRHWPGPRSLATTSGVSVDVLSSGYLDVSVPQVCLASLWIQLTIPVAGWVAPFGNPRIKACSRLPEACRSVPRPSSPLGAKASTRCPCFPRPTPATTAPRPPRGRTCHCRPDGRFQQQLALQRPSRPHRAKGPHTHANSMRLPADGTRRAERITCQRPSTQRCTKDATSLVPVNGLSSPPYDVKEQCPTGGRPRHPTRMRQPGCRGGASLPGRPRVETRATRTHAAAAAGLVGLGRLERPTSRLSGVRSNQLSYRPESHPKDRTRHRHPHGRGLALPPDRPEPVGRMRSSVVRRDVQTAVGLMASGDA